MTNILIIKSLFAPNDKYFKTNCENICDLFLYLNITKITASIHVLLCGWLNKSNYKSELVKLITSIKKSENTITINFDIWGINYGKFKILNNLKNYTKNYENIKYVLYMDHDIKLKDNFFDDIVETSKIKFYALNQTGDNRHQMTIYENIQNINVYRIGIPQTNGSIASGCFIIFPSLIKILPEFENHLIYGFDDSRLCAEIQNLGFDCVVLLDYYVIHPYDENNTDTYKKWKLESIIKSMNNSVTKNDYYKQIQESNNFWINL